MTQRPPPPVKRGRPPKAEADERRERFLEHALQTFSRKGYRDTTMDELAASFGASKATAYRTYGSKAGLVLATMLRGVPKVRLPLQAVDASDDRPPADVLQDFARVLIDAQNDPGNRALWQAVSEARQELGAGLEEIFLREAETLAPIAEYLARQEALGHLEVGHPQLAASQFAIQISGGLSDFLAGARRSMDDERVQFALHLFLRAVSRPRRLPAAPP